jgi:hypothetical protein
MIRVTGVFLTILLLVSCSTSSRLSRMPGEHIDIAQNEEEYELLVLDPGFENWFASTWNPAVDRTLQYYSFWNQRYVTEWNNRVIQPNSSQFFENMIQYDPSENYGIEVERKLYYYFRWVDTKLGIPILSTPPPVL